MISGLMTKLGIQTQFSSSKKVVGEASRVKKTPQNNQQSTSGKQLEQDTFTSNKTADEIKINSGDKFEKTPQKK